MRVTLESISEEDLYFALQRYGNKIQDNKKSYDRVKEEEFERLQLLRPLPVLDERSLVSDEVVDDFEIASGVGNSEDCITLEDILPHEITGHIEGILERLNTNVNLQSIGEDEPIDYSKPEPPVPMLDETGEEAIIHDDLIDEEGVVIESEFIEEPEIEEIIEDEDEEEIIEDDDDEIEEPTYEEDEEEELIEEDEEEEIIEEDEEEIEEDEEEIEEDEEDEEELIDEDDDDWEEQEEEDLEDEEEEEIIEEEDEEEEEIPEPTLVKPVVPVQEAVVRKVEPVQPVIQQEVKITKPVITREKPKVEEPKQVMTQSQPSSSSFDIPNNPRPPRVPRGNSSRVPRVEGSASDFINKALGGQNNTPTQSSTINNSTPQKVVEEKVENLPPDPISYLRLHPRAKEDVVKKLYSAKKVDEYINRGLITRARGVLLI
ncbi:hypothetical protein P9X10_00390 [Bacillus cereus]|nr:hypothetical protein [Bacillus cereus]